MVCRSGPRQFADSAEYRDRIRRQLRLEALRVDIPRLSLNMGTKCSQFAQRNAVLLGNKLKNFFSTAES